MNNQTTHIPKINFKKSKTVPLPNDLAQYDLDPCTLLENLAEESDSYQLKDFRKVMGSLNSTTNSADNTPSTASNTLYSYVLKHAHSNSPITKQSAYDYKPSFEGYAKYQPSGRKLSLQNTQETSENSGNSSKRTKSKSLTRMDQNPGKIIKPSIFSLYKDETRSNSRERIKKACSLNIYDFPERNTFFCDLLSLIRKNEDEPENETEKTTDILKEEPIFRSYSFKEMHELLRKNSCLT